MTNNPGFRELMAEHWELAKNLRSLRIYFEPDKCTGVFECYAACPVGCWTPDYANRMAIFHDAHLCIACGACVLQCPEDAITLR